jgi:uncharacterized protein
LSGIFVDTSGWANLLVRTEPYHRPAIHAINVAQRDQRRIVTSSYVLAELSALLLSPLRVSREVRLAMLNRIRTASWVEVVFVDESQDSASWEYLFSRRDKDFSLIDCSSFEIMRRRQLHASLTADAHFDQAGFHRLLR